MMKNKDFAIYIMVHGRPHKMWTEPTLRRAGYTGKIYFVDDSSDVAVKDYRAKYGDDLLVFDKEEVAKKYDAGDNSGDYRSTLYPANTIMEFAKEKGTRYFMIMCDDYTSLGYRFDSNLNYKYKAIKNLDAVLDGLIEFYKKTPAKTIAIAQGGDFIGGSGNQLAEKPKLSRKAMNSFLCSTDRPFKFVGRLNEDVTTYVNLGSRGDLFLTINNVSLSQKPHQAEELGLTEVYLDNGTYVKSFFSVMYNPSCVKVAEMGGKFKRVHHKVLWNNAVPKIVSEDYKK